MKTEQELRAKLDRLRKYMTDDYCTGWADAVAHLFSDPVTQRRTETMSDTITDMPKVCQMLDNGWSVMLFKNDLGSYTAQATTENYEAWERAKAGVLAQILAANPDGDASALRELNDDFETDGTIDTDDFTPEQALTRLAYKVHGEIM